MKDPILETCYQDASPAHGPSTSGTLLLPFVSEIKKSYVGLCVGFA